MKRIKVREQGRMAASLALSMAVVGGLAAVTVGPAESAEPVEDCWPAYPLADEGIADDTVVWGETVSKGTAPTRFEGTILGVIEDGIAPGLDMVMAELDSDAIDAAGGIWQGMSGSPVYVGEGEDRQLLGAVAYGLSWGPSPIAGITPFEEMDDYLGTPAAPARVKVDDATARSVARQTDVTARQAGEFSQLRMPFGISGIGSRRLDKADGFRKEHRYLPRNTYRMGAAAAPGAGPGAETVVAGGNLAVAQSYGDITFGGVGTATSVCGGEVVGFGHPATFLGETTMTLHPAKALFVQPESLGAPFKVANLGAPVGTITDDHLTGVTGTFGALPDETTITSDLTYLKNGRQRTGSSFVSTPDANAAVTFYQQLANHDRVLDGIVKGSELMTWSVTGDDNGTPFELTFTDRYASNYDIAFEAPWEVADIVWFLSSFEGVTVDDVEVVGDVINDSSTWRVVTVKQKQGGSWVTVNRRTPALATEGGTMRLQVTLDGPGDERIQVPVAVAVPERAQRRGRLEVLGGGWMWTDYWSSNDVDDIVKALDGAVRNDAVAAVLSFDSRRSSVTRRGESAPTERVVYGRKRIDVRVR